MLNVPQILLMKRGMCIVYSHEPFICSTLILLEGGLENEWTLENGPFFHIISQCQWTRGSKAHKTCYTMAEFCIIGKCIFIGRCELNVHGPGGDGGVFVSLSEDVQDGKLLL